MFHYIWAPITISESMTSCHERVPCIFLIGNENLEGTQECLMTLASERGSVSTHHDARVIRQQGVGRMRFWRRRPGRADTPATLSVRYLVRESTEYASWLRTNMSKEVERR